MADGVQDDDETFGPPLPPEDRLWRHPSEIASATSTERGAMWGTALVSAAGGAFLVGALWLTLGARSDGGTATQLVALVPVESVAPVLTSEEEWTAEVTRAARPATAGVQRPDDTDTIAGAVAIRDDGVYVTSGRAIGDATDVVIVDSTGARHDADVVGYDALTDVSVLKTDQGTTPAVVDLAARVEEGDTLAVLDPDGDAAEHVVADDVATSPTIGGDTLVGVIVLDGFRAVPPGSPAVDGTGAVVGVIAATPEGDAAALVPIDLATDVAAELIERGAADHPRLGVTAVDAPEPATVGTTVDERPAGGALVTSVDPLGPAAWGGMVIDDVVVRVDGAAVDSLAEMMLALRRHRPGDIIDVVVRRGGEEVSCRVELGASVADEPAR